MNTAVQTQTAACDASASRKRQLWAKALRQRSVWMRALRLGLPVGLLQATINQGDYWIHGPVDRVVIVKSIVSPLIGFTLVLFSAAATWVQRSIEQSNS
jgi:hypothetical protein